MRFAMNPNELLGIFFYISRRLCTCRRASRVTWRTTHTHTLLYHLHSRLNTILIAQSAIFSGYVYRYDWVTGNSVHMTVHSSSMIIIVFLPSMSQTGAVESVVMDLVAPDSISSSFGKVRYHVCSQMRRGLRNRRIQISPSLQ